MSVVGPPPGWPSGTIVAFVVLASTSPTFASPAHTREYEPAGTVATQVQGNMLNDPKMPPVSGGPMDRDNPNGNAGMCRAALFSSGVGC